MWTNLFIYPWQCNKLRRKRKIYELIEQDGKKGVKGDLPTDPEKDGSYDIAKR
jgi:hypothetical protein